jgi:hypothetical protein
MKSSFSTFHSWSRVLILFALAIVVRSAVAQTFPVVTIYATDPQAGEAGPDPGMFTVRRTGSIDYPVTVFYRLSGTASNGVDYDQLGSWVQIPAGALAASFIVKPIDDLLVEGDETVVAEITPSPLACATCGYNIGVSNTATIRITDNDAGTNRPPFVRLNAPQNGEIFVAPANIVLRAYAQDEEDGYDVDVEFFEGPRSLGMGTFVPALCPAPYCPYYALVWSNVPPGDYILTARATDSDGATSVSDPTHIIVVESNRPPGVNIYAIDPNASEIASAPNIDPPSNPAVFTVRRSDDTNSGIVVFYAISGTASNGIDYQGLSGYVTLPPGVSSANIVVNPFDDNLLEDTETVVLTLTPPCPQCLFANPPCDVAQGTNCFQIGPNNQATAFIRDNDTTQSNLPPAVSMVRPTDGQIFEASRDIPLVAFAQDREDGYTLTVEFFEGSRSLGFGTFFPGRCAVCPNYELTWSNVPPGRYELSAKATDSDGASSFSVPVHITVLESNALPVVNIVARDPIAVEGQFCWSNWWWTTSWESSGWITSGGYPILWPSPTNRCIGTNNALFVVHRDGSTNADLIVHYEIGGTALNGVDYAMLSGSVKIPVGRNSAPIVVTAMDDSLLEGIETVLLKLQSSSDYAIGFPPRATAIIVDNDRPRPPCALLTDRQFHFCQPATNGYCFRIEASTDLLHWWPLCTNIVTDGALHFIDPDASPLNARFYRTQPEPALPPDN